MLKYDGINIIIGQQYFPEKSKHIQIYIHILYNILLHIYTYSYAWKKT